MISMLVRILVIDDYVIDYPPISREARKCLIHPPVVMFGYGGYTIRCSQKLEAAKWREKSGQILACCSEGALVVAFHRVHLGEDLGMVCGYVGHHLCRGIRLIVLTPHISIQMG